MKKILTLLLMGLLTSVSVLHAQFDDLYADADNVIYVAADDNSYAEEEYDDYTYDNDSYDDYDEYWDYRRSNYDIDAYTYTNRLDRYRLAYFTTRYYGPTLTLNYGDAFYNDLAWRISTDRQFRNYLNRSLIFGSSYSNIYVRYGNFGNPYSPLWDRFGINNGYIGNRGLAGYYGGFGGVGGFNAYCPPSSYARYRNTTNFGGRSSSDIRQRVFAPRESSSTVRSRSVRAANDTRFTNNRAVRTVAERNRVTTSDRRRGTNRVRSTRTRVTRPSGATRVGSNNTRIRTNNNRVRSNNNSRFKTSRRSNSTSRVRSSSSVRKSSSATRSRGNNRSRRNN